MPTTNYLWDDETDTVVMEVDGDDNTTAVYHSDPVPNAGPFSMRRGGKTYNYRYDGQGNTRALTDETGQITDTYNYDAFGNEIAKTGTTKNPYRFRGQYGYQYNEATGDYYVRRTVYDPKTARVTSRPDAEDMAAQALLDDFVESALSNVQLILDLVMIARGVGYCPVFCRESAQTMRDMGRLFMTPVEGNVFHEGRKNWSKKNFSGATGISVGIHFKQSPESKKNNWCCCDGQNRFEFIQFFKSKDMAESRTHKPVHIDGAVPGQGQRA